MVLSLAFLPKVREQTITATAPEVGGTVYRGLLLRNSTSGMCPNQGWWERGSLKQEESVDQVSLVGHFIASVHAAPGADSRDEADCRGVGLLRFFCCADRDSVNRGVGLMPADRRSCIRPTSTQRNRRPGFARVQPSHAQQLQQAAEAACVAPLAAGQVKRIELQRCARQAELNDSQQMLCCDKAAASVLLLLLTDDGSTARDRVPFSAVVG